MGWFSRLVGQGARHPESETKEPEQGAAGLSISFEGLGGFTKDTDWSQIAYICWSALDGACSICKNAEQWVWLPECQVEPPPHPRCQHPEGCRCMCFFTPKTQTDALDTAAFIRSHGGRVRQAEIDAWQEARQAPKMEARELERASSDSAQKAREAEKRGDLEEAIRLYRESIALNIRADSLAPDAWSMRNLPYHFNRLTLVLERSHRFPDALDAIREFEELRVMDPQKTEATALAKRKIRLVRKVEADQMDGAKSTGTGDGSA